MSSLTAKIRRSQDFPDGVEDRTCISGGVWPAQTWDEYVGDYSRGWPEVLAAVRAAVERHGLTSVSASHFCNEHHFELSDGRLVSFSWRAWGDLLSAIRGKREGYLAFYCDGDRLPEGWSPDVD